MGELRWSAAIRVQRNRSEIERITAVGYLVMLTKHPVFATFLCEPLGGMQRWQRWSTIVTLLLTALMINSAL